MRSSATKDPEYLSIKQVSEQTGIGASTIRYYDQQFEDYLQIKRGSGRRRLFSSDAVDRLLTLNRLLKEKGLSLRQARQVLSGGNSPVVPQQGFEHLELEVANLKSEVAGLKKQVDDLKEIQSRTLALLDQLTK
jgi:DNA-binding transcriptional MerR regulator